MQEKNIKIYCGQDLSLKIIGDNLSFLMKKKGADISRLSRDTGIGIATIKNLRRGVGNPTISTLSAIADFFHVTVGMITDSYILQSSDYTCNNILSIPLVKYSEIECYISNSFVPVSKYITEVDNPKDDSIFAFEVMNNAFSPEIERSSICIVSLNEKINDGDIVLVKIKDYPILLRRVFFGAEGMMFFNLSLEIDTSPIQYKNHNIMAVLLKIVKRLK